MGDIMADALEDLAAKIGSAQDEISDMAADIDPSDADGEVDPSDPDGEVDPGSPSDGDDIDPGDIDPSDPDANPGDPPEPTEPDGDVPDPDEGDADDGIELPEPAEPEEGGFAEIQLIPDPVPLAGRWEITSKRGTSVCVGKAAGRRTSFVDKLKKDDKPRKGRIVVLNDGRTLRGTKIGEGQAAPLLLQWDPSTERFKGSVRTAAPGGRAKTDFNFRVLGAGRMEGELIGNTRVRKDGVTAKCTVSRGVSMKHAGGGGK